MPLSTLCDARDVADMLGLDFADALRLVIMLDAPDTQIISIESKGTHNAEA